MNTLMSAAATIPLPLPLFLLAVSFIYGVLKFFFPALPFTQEQIQFVLVELLALLGIVVTASARVHGLF